MNGISGLIKEKSQRALLPSPSPEDTMRKNDRLPPGHPDILISGFHPPELRNKFLFFIKPPVYGILW